MNSCSSLFNVVMTEIIRVLSNNLGFKMKNTRFHIICWANDSVLSASQIILNRFSTITIVIQGRLNSVSYTHLDVYKRQSWNLSLFYNIIIRTTCQLSNTYCHTGQVYKH